MTVQSAPRWYVRVLPVALALLLVTAPVWAAIFTDIQGLPTQRAIERLAAKGIVRAASGTTFNPNGPVTRGEFAVLLVRALGLNTQGLTLPAFKDAADIPRDQQGAVAVLASLGTVTPRTAQVKKGELVYTLSTDKPVYNPGEPLLLKIVVENTGKETVKFQFANSLHFDFVIREADGSEVARASVGAQVIPGDQEVALVGGGKFEFAKFWKQLDQNDEVVSAGRYEIVGIHRTKAGPTSLSVFFNKGVMTADPDNTFRPKQELTRLELATVTARSMGLADAAASALTVTDAGAVPQAARGTVAAALEKRVLSVVGNREFRPAQRATRSEVAQALDVLMDTLKRYNFARGTLKDPVTGSPPQLTIEDERKALRTFRVARNHAIYLNDRPAELRDLRPGDALLFLNIGDVGDVAYIEATRR